MGATKTPTDAVDLDVELDGKTYRKLQELAKRRHDGDLSATVVALIERETKLMAAEAFLKKHGKLPPLSDEQAADIESKWSPPRGARPPKKKGRRRAKAA